MMRVGHDGSPQVGAVPVTVPVLAGQPGRNVCAKAKSPAFAGLLLVLKDQAEVRID
jgi:hypothetical protein